MSAFVSALRELDRTDVAIAGGKGAHLGALARLEGLRVPEGFCVKTDAFRRFVAETPAVADRLEQLARLAGLAGLDARGAEAIGAAAAELRHTMEAAPIPDDVAAAIARALAELGEGTACAVRSSATAEDSPTASFAGQHDSHLGVTGAAAILAHVRRCWASLYTDRAVLYRARQGLDQRRASMAVVVQRMLDPRASGVAFTADPVTSNRKIVSIEATFGLGEALVSGRVRPDVYRVRAGAIVERAIAAERRVLTDEEVLHLAALARRIEAHLGAPQDLEWCLVDGTFHLVQSRPITTLFPIPARDDDEPHVYLSVGHQQMMTDALSPLGLSLFQRTAGRPMFEAGGRLFVVDVTRALALPASRTSLLEMLGRSEPLTRDALETLLRRGDLVPTLEDASPPGPAGEPRGAGRAAPPAGAAPAPLEADPALVPALIARTEASLAALKPELRARSGAEVFDVILADLQALKRLLFDPESHRVLMSGIEATWWLNDQLEAWLGEKNAADALAQSVPHDVTSQMGLALLDVADVVRRHPAVIAVLERAEDDGFFAALAAVPGGREASAALEGWLERYGARCVGEIDVARPRWRERPTTLVPLVLAHVRTSTPGRAAERFERGLAEASRKEEELLARVRALPDGAARAEETKRMIDRVRTFIGYREYPKYGMICRYFEYKQAFEREAARLVETGVLADKSDIYQLTLEELHEVARTGRADAALVRRRRETSRAHAALRPPRVLTSEGEVLTGAYRRDDVPSGALVGLAVSAGVVEGRARVVSELAAADLGPEDILVTTFTDPSWTPVFLAVRGVVTEVGGLMTHGAVIAREYGLPAVVGVERATERIRDGQRIRIDGTNGWVELLPASQPGVC